ISTASLKKWRVEQSPKQSARSANNAVKLSATSQTMPNQNNRSALILDSVHAVETPFSPDSVTVCASPICSIQFKPSGMAMEPRRYCSDECRQSASLIRRARELLRGFSDTE